MFFYVLCVIFFFFAHKQIYAGSHFTGSNKKIGTIIGIIGIVNMLATFAFWVYTAIKVSILISVVLFVVSMIFTYIVNRIFAKVSFKEVSKMDIKQEDLQFIIYNSRCDVFATITSEVGTIVNLLILIIYVVSKII